jgi:hypothetical protein
MTFAALAAAFQLQKELKKQVAKGAKQKILSLYGDRIIAIVIRI